MSGISSVDGVHPQLWAEGTYAVLEAELALYPIAAAIAAGYKYTDRAYVWLQSSPRPGHYCVFLKPKHATVDRSQVASDFSNELLDQALRHELAERFSPLRTIITAQAFSEGNLLDAVADAGTSERD
jgi:His-Xaa-Ser system protein HxsD